MKTLVVVPGYNELSQGLHHLIDGRSGVPGLAQRGYDCVFFDEHRDDLDQRVDKLRDFVVKLKGERPEASPLATLGYSAGGIVVRALVRKYPELSEIVTHTIQLGAPNWGFAVGWLPELALLGRFSDKGLPELDIRSAFMHRLNGTGGHWVRRGRWKFWQLDAPPVVGPQSSAILSIFGQVPKYGDDNDGIVWCDSAALGGGIRFHAIRDDDANHLNLVGLYHIATRIVKGFIANDRIWPRVLDAATRFIETGESGPNPESAAAVRPLG